jgi:hypothetical protein
LSLCGCIDGLQEELENLQKRLAEAEAAEAARKKPKEEKIPKGTLVVEGLVIDEWVSVFCIQPVSLAANCFQMSSCCSHNCLCGAPYDILCSPYFSGPTTLKCMGD